MLLLLRAHFSFCQLPLLEFTSNLALLCSNSHQTNPNSTPHTLIIMDFNSTTTSSSMLHNTTESVTFDIAWQNEVPHQQCRLISGNFFNKYTIAWDHGPFTSFRMVLTDFFSLCLTLSS